MEQEVQRKLIFSDCLSEEPEEESQCNMASCEFEVQKIKFGANFDQSEQHQRVISSINHNVG